MRAINFTFGVEVTVFKKNSQTPAGFHGRHTADWCRAPANFHRVHPPPHGNPKLLRSTIAALEIFLCADDEHPANEPATGRAFPVNATCAARIQNEQRRRNSGKVPKPNYPSSCSPSRSQHQSIKPTCLAQAACARSRGSLRLSFGTRRSGGAGTIISSSP